ncbi:6738_t:CDS:1 [Ambispora gerdemannii]|uniref:6738_t:CDS:1 n=1 Tax=Ambispora gerdemannii TaxID=144530 RepID=A0A9N8YK06_9GLOM|nr:6738_t:CDS:1 [Ambispora gerdemannii]
MAFFSRNAPLPILTSRPFSLSVRFYAQRKTHARKPKALTKLFAPIYDTVTLDDGSLFVARKPLNEPPPISPDELPPPLKPVKTKAYHITDDQIQEMQKLRLEHPKKWTRQRLAEKYNCSAFYVGIVAPTTEEERQRIERRIQHRINRFSEKRKYFMKIREERRKLW